MIAYPLDADPNSAKASSLCQQHSFFDGTAKKLFIPGAIPLRFLAIPQVGGGAALNLEKTADDPDPAVTFPEGEHVISLSSTKKQVFRLTSDSTAPETHLDLPEVPRAERNGATYYGKGLVLNLTAVDPISGVDSIYVSMNQAKFEALKSPKIPRPQDGVFSLRYLACDRVGNAEALHLFDFRVDVTAPVSTLAIKASIGSGAYGPQTTIALRSVDNGVGVQSIFYAFNTSEPKPYANEIALTDLKAGEHIVKYFAVDALDNKEATQVHRFYYDPQSPDLALEFEGEQHKEGDMVYVAKGEGFRVIAADKESGIVATKVTVDFKVVEPKDGLYELPTTEGLTEVVAIATDGGGNQTRLEQKIYIDASVPVVAYEVLGSADKEQDTIVALSPFRLRLSAQDVGSGVKEISYCIDKDPCQVFRDSLVIESPGTHTIAIHARDLVEQEADPMTLSVRVSRPNAHVATAAKAEKTQWVADSKASTIGPAAQGFRLEIADGPGVNAFRLAFAVPSDALAKEFVGKDGQRHFVVSVAGFQASLAIPVDGMAPRSSHQAAGAQVFEKEGKRFFGGGLKMSLSAVDVTALPYSGVKQIFFGVNGGSFEPYHETLARQFLSEQSYILRYYSSDRVGNLEAVHEFAFTLDTTSPRTTLTFLPPFHKDAISRSGGIALAATDALSGVSKIFFNFDDFVEQEYEEGGFAKQLRELKPGAHHITFHAADAVGNSEAEQKMAFTIDDGAPRVAIEGTPGLLLSDGKVFHAEGIKVSLKTQDDITGVKDILFTIDGKDEKPSTALFDPATLSKGDAVAFTAIDKVGNRSVPLSVAFVLDKTAPESHLRFDGPYHLFENKIYVKPQTKIFIDSEDIGSGIKSAFFRINSDDYQIFGKELKFAADSDLGLSFYSEDKVGNREKPKYFRVIVDDQTPKLSVRDQDGNVIQNKSPLSPATLVHLSAIDSQSGIRNIYFRLNSGERRLYRQPFKITDKGKVTLEVTAIDWVGREDLTSIAYVVE